MSNSCLNSNGCHIKPGNVLRLSLLKQNTPHCLLWNPRSVTSNRTLNPHRCQKIFYLLLKTTLLPLIFDCGVAENKRGRKSLAFFGWPKIKAKIFPKHLYNRKQKRKKFIHRRWPKIQGAELGEGGRKLEGPKI